MKSMNKREYFLQGLRDGQYRHKGWVIECFTVVDPRNVHVQRAYRGLQIATGTEKRPGDLYFMHDGEPVYLTNSEAGKPLFAFMDPLILLPGDLENVTETVDTCYGNALVNACAIIYAFGGKMSFLTGPLKVSGIEKKIEPRLIGNDDVPDGARNLTIAEYKKFCDGITYLNGFTALCVPAATPKTLTVDKAVLKRRDELLKENKDRLDDPLVQAHIAAELVKMDRASFKGDPAERFYIKDKSFEVVRKNLHLFVGQESGFGKKGNFIKNSLAEGWDIEELPSMANAMREASFNRGSRTALGGVEAKNNYRIFQNTVVAEADCGTKLGLRLTLTKDVAKYWLNYYVIEKDGSTTELTVDNIDQYTDKPIIVRSPAYCKTAKQNLCGMCVGSKTAKTPTAISTQCADLGAKFTLTFLAAAHTVALKSNKFAYDDLLH
jgi:hypothetical protein